MIKAREVEAILKKANMPPEVRRVFFQLAEDQSQLKQEIVTMASAFDMLARTVNLLSEIMGAQGRIIQGSTDAGMREQIEKLRAPGVDSEKVPDA